MVPSNLKTSLMGAAKRFGGFVVKGMYLSRLSLVGQVHANLDVHIVVDERLDMEIRLLKNIQILLKNGTQKEIHLTLKT